ncbi:RDD family protein [Rhodococcus sp. NPDC058532]|uniref:RDD family protein n=1 Tax=Rhodococcus sp. NPDC058532 TaxID=3346540 RepID=UPI003648B277
MTPAVPERRPAGIVTRGLAAAVDLGVVLTLLGLGYLALVFVRLLLSPQAFSFPAPELLMSVTAWLGTSVVYLTGCWATTGRTVGSLAMGLRVTTRWHRRVRWATALLRALACVFFPIGLVWVVVDPRRRSIQDIVLRTVVVYDWRQDLDTVTA